MPDAIWIDRGEALGPLASALEAQVSIGLDTEFLRERTFFPKLCLVQLAAAGEVWCVDTLRVGSLEPLVPALTAPGSRKVIHAARQDLEAFYLNVKRVISPVFDTQIAAGCIGLKPQIGYADLVKTLLDVPLAKGQTRTDWSKRPLTAAQLEYAADDVQVLERGRLQADRALARAGARALGDRGLPGARGSAAVRARPRAGLEAAAQFESVAAGRARARPRIAVWRETMARERDLPRGWITARCGHIQRRARPVPTRGRRSMPRSRLPRPMNDALAAEPARGACARDRARAGDDTEPVATRAPPRSRRPSIERLGAAWSMRARRNSGSAPRFWRRAASSRRWRWARARTQALVGMAARGDRRPAARLPSTRAARWAPAAPLSDRASGCSRTPVCTSASASTTRSSPAARSAG